MYLPEFLLMHDPLNEYDHTFVILTKDPIFIAVVRIFPAQVISTEIIQIMSGLRTETEEAFYNEKALNFYRSKVKAPQKPCFDGRADGIYVALLEYLCKICGNDYYVLRTIAPCCIIRIDDTQNELSLPLMLDRNFKSKLISLELTKIVLEHYFGFEKDEREYAVDETIDLFSQFRNSNVGIIQFQNVLSSNQICFQCR